MSRVEADLMRGRIKEQISRLRELEVIPTKSSKWVSISSQPMIADDKALERLFQTKPEVSFVELGEKLTRSAGRRKQPQRLQGGNAFLPHIFVLQGCFVFLPCFLFCVTFCCSHHHHPGSKSE